MHYVTTMTKIRLVLWHFMPTTFFKNPINTYLTITYMVLITSSKAYSRHKHMMSDFSLGSFKITDIF